MARNPVKFAALEENGVELTVQTERIPLAKDIAMETNPDLVSDNLQDATTEASKVPFSYNLIKDEKTVNIPDDQQMLVIDDMELVGSGEIIIAGELMLGKLV